MHNSKFQFKSTHTIKIYIKRTYINTESIIINSFPFKPCCQTCCIYTFTYTICVTIITSFIPRKCQCTIITIPVETWRDIFTFTRDGGENLDCSLGPDATYYSVTPSCKPSYPSTVSFVRSIEIIYAFLGPVRFGTDSYPWFYPCLARASLIVAGQAFSGLNDKMFSS